MDRASGARPAGEALGRDNQGDPGRVEDIVSACGRYEQWLASHCPLDADDLRVKHARLAKSPFHFFRGTYFRWAQQAPSLLPALDGAVRVDAVGDIHVENFGSWRDAEGRLVWGIHDFDEAASMPYVWDLVRLACSAWLSRGLRGGGAPLTNLAFQVIKGYRKGLREPAPAVIVEDRFWLHEHLPVLACGDPDFWTKERREPPIEPPPVVRRLFDRALPATADQRVFRRRHAGLGSRGRLRFSVTARWQGASVLREAKAWAPSAWLWARNQDAAPLLTALPTGEFRSPDPSLQVGDGYVVRRLAADCLKLELGALRGDGLNGKLLRAMAADLAAVHAASVSAEALIEDLEHRREGWLTVAIARIAAATQADFKVWRKYWRARARSGLDDDTTQGRTDRAAAIQDHR